MDDSRPNGGGKAAPGTVRGLMQSSDSTLSPAERRVARALLAEYPVAGLESAGRLAERAGVSGATVVRFATRLGFAGYPDLQESLRREVQERMSSPLVLFERRAAPEATDDHVLGV